MMQFVVAYSSHSAVVVHEKFLTMCVVSVTEVQGEAEHAGDLRDEPVAGHAAARDGGLGRGGSPRRRLAALRGPRCGHHHQ